MPNLRFHDIDVRYHQQDQIDYCGEAVAQMILGRLGLLIGRQDDLRGSLNVLGGSGLRPQDVAVLLNDPRITGGSAFSVQPDTTASDGVRRIFASLATSGSAVPTSILQGQHWVAVSGAVFDDDAPGEPEILGFFVDNPEPDAPGVPIPAHPTVPPAPPHAANDTCGFGNGYGSPKTFIALHEWLAFYWAQPSNQNAFVTIPRGAAEPALQGSIARETSLPRPVKPKSPADLCPIIKAGIARYGLDHPGSPFASKLAGVTCVAPPILQVAAMSSFPGSLRSSEPFHIVRIQGSDGSDVNVRIGVDGSFLSVEAPASFIPFTEDLFDFASSALERYEAANGPLSTSFVTGERHFTVHPTLVWQPCRQSMSPFQPFVQINLAGAMVFVTMDGQVHRQLHNHDGTLLLRRSSAHGEGG